MDAINELKWNQCLEEELKKDYYLELAEFVRNEYKYNKIYPPSSEIFRAFALCPFDKVKVVILGQDPYHGPNQANGLAFSVRNGIKVPPSLVNIYKELKSDLKCQIPDTGDLEPWAHQGVLLLNATLTVKARAAGSHQKRGWEKFTDAVIALLSGEKDGLVFILWGAYAQRKGKMIDRAKHLVLSSSHPSPLSAYSGFFGSKPFSKTNNYLRSQGKKTINWCLISTNSTDLKHQIM